MEHMEVLGDDGQEDGAAPKMIDVCVGHLVLGLDEYHSVAELVEAGFDRELDTRELTSMVTKRLARPRVHLIMPPSHLLDNLRVQILQCRMH